MDSSLEPHSIRITNSGNIQGWVKFSLDFLQQDENANRPLVFHSLPATPKDSAVQKPVVNPSSVVNNTARLISVVEIVKREYVKLLETKHSARLLGLHQYNQIGTLEDLEIIHNEENAEESNEERRLQELSMTLEGKNFPKQKQTPFLKIYLCCNEVPDLVSRGATYQSPTKRKLSKSAKAKARKRQKVGEKVPDEAANT